MKKGLRLRSIDRKATTAAQERAISNMEPTVISVQEGEIILRKGERVTAADLEKYQEYLDLALEDSVLLPKRIFVTIVILLFGVVYVSLVLPRFWNKSAIRLDYLSALRVRGRRGFGAPGADLAYAVVILWMSAISSTIKEPFP